VKQTVGKNFLTFLMVLVLTVAAVFLLRFCSEQITKQEVLQYDTVFQQTDTPEISVAWEDSKLFLVQGAAVAFVVVVPIAGTFIYYKVKKKKGSSEKNKHQQ
jgi:hypothetical protein